MPTSYKGVRAVVLEYEERRTIMVALNSNLRGLKDERVRVDERLQRGEITQQVHDRGVTALNNRLRYVRSLRSKVWPEPLH